MSIKSILYWPSTARWYRALSLPKQIGVALLIALGIYIFFAVLLSMFIRLTLQAGLWVALRATGYAVFHYTDNVFGILCCAGLLFSLINGRFGRIAGFFIAFRRLFTSGD